FSKGLPSVVNFYRFYMYNDGTDNSELTFVSPGRGVWHTGLYGKNPVLRTPEAPENAISGIVYNAYEGTWTNVPNFNSISPVKKGKHKFTLTYFQGTGGRSLGFSWQGPGITKQVVPADVLYRLSPMSDCPGNGSISVERWNGVGGTSVTNIPTGTAPSVTYTLL